MKATHCPFCASYDTEVEELGYNALGHVRCKQCGATGPTAELNRKNAIAAWNRREWPTDGASDRPPKVRTP